MFSFLSQPICLVACFLLCIFIICVHFFLFKHCFVFCFIYILFVLERRMSIKIFIFVGYYYFHCENLIFQTFRLCIFIDSYHCQCSWCPEANQLQKTSNIPNYISKLWMSGLYFMQGNLVHPWSFLLNFLFKFMPHSYYHIQIDDVVSFILKEIILNNSRTFW